MAWYYWVIVLGVLALMYVMLIVRQKRQEKQSKQIMESFKVGDKVITHIGIYGKIKRIYNTTYGKVCVLEIGTLDKIDIEVDMRYIAGIDEKTAVADEEPTKPEEQKQEEQKTEEVQEKKSKKKN
ncbi:MAG: preprotein translocase subunit YajC [Clostridiales bacterium]|nr:preprotein translocase subunit YajC [Clostridiales bacterium]